MSPSGHEVSRLFGRPTRIIRVVDDHFCREKFRRNRCLYRKPKPERNGDDGPEMHAHDRRIEFSKKTNAGQIRHQRRMSCEYNSVASSMRDARQYSSV